jgi:tyrosine-protein phosphatase SIW14
VKTRVALLLSVSLILAGAPAWAASGQPLAATRPAEWATAVEGTSVVNLYRIEDGLYRGAQPTADGFKELAALGVKCVLDVAGGAGDAALVEGGALKLFHVPMTAFGLRDDRVLEALRIMADPQNRPLLIHCQHGADRTGAMVALYRVLFQGWTPEKAVLEMNRGGYHHSSLFRNLETYVLKADAAALRRKLGIAGPPPEAPAASGSVAAAAPAP